MIKVPNKEYWIRRSELTLITIEKSALQYEQELKKAYLEATQKITKEIEAFYGRYAKDNQISLLETRKRLRPDELLNFNKQAKLYLDEIERLGDKAFTAEYREYLKKLSGKAYISRLEELITNIRHNIETLSTGYNEGLGKELKNAYEDSFYRTIFDVQKQAGFGISFTTPGGKQLEMAIRERWMGQNYSDRIWADKNRMLMNLEQTLAQEFVRGRNPREVSREFARKMNTSYHNAQRLIRTELNYISNKGTMKAYEESGVVNSFQYVSTLDRRTSDICREMDGKVFTIKEGQVGVNIPPLHPYCRSTTIPYFPDDEISDLIEDRVARDEDGEGKSYKLGKNVTFFEWVEQYGSPEFKKRVQEQRKRFLDMDKPSFDSSAWYETMEKQDLKTMESWCDDWLKVISPEERDSIRTYTGSAYKDMNQYLRGQRSSTDYADEIKQATAALKKASLPEEVIVRRGSDYNMLTEFGIDISETNKDKVIGALVTDKGFMSTSPSPDGGFGGHIEYVIKVPKGSQAMYVDTISLNRGEEELLINRGGKYIIEDVEFDSYYGDVKKIYMTLKNLKGPK